jgi:hypothetical protein
MWMDPWSDSGYGLVTALVMLLAVGAWHLIAYALHRFARRRHDDDNYRDDPCGIWGGEVVAFRRPPVDLRHRRARLSALSSRRADLAQVRVRSRIGAGVDGDEVA